MGLSQLHAGMVDAKVREIVVRDAVLVDWTFVELIRLRMWLDSRRDWIRTPTGVVTKLDVLQRLDVVIAERAREESA